MTDNTSNVIGARDHARAQSKSDAAATRFQPTIPVGLASNLATGVDSTALVWDERIGSGGYCSKFLERGARVRIESEEGDACVSFLAFRADNTHERLCMADTIKVQWQAYIGKGHVLLSDMGRAMLSIVEDSSGRHDTLCGASTIRSNQTRFGEGANHSTFPNARDRFRIALAKHGLTRRDIPANINFFKSVRVDADGTLQFDESPGVPGEAVVLRAEMPVLVVLANTPHVLDPRTNYCASSVRVTAWNGPGAAGDDAIRNGSPEMRRAFENTEDVT